MSTSEIKDHATYGASSSERWLNCAGSIRLTERAPPQAESIYAAEGTAAHACFEFLLRAATNGGLEQALTPAAAKWGVEPTKHGREAVEWIIGQYDPSEYTILFESKVDASSFTRPGEFGTLDVAVYDQFDDQGTLTVMDYKYGAGIAVDAADENGNVNSQLAYYALAVAHRLKYRFKYVRLVVIQPRAFHPSGETIREHTITIEQLKAWIPRFKAGVQACEKDAAPTKAGKWCRFCAASVICPTLKDQAFVDAQIVFDDESGLQRAPAPNMIQLPHLGTVLDGCEKLETWIASVREHAQTLLHYGAKVEGWKLVDKRAQRKWRDEDSVAKLARKRFGDVAFSPPSLLSPAQLEKATKKIKGADEWIAENVTRESSGKNLVRDTDKRPQSDSIDVVFKDVPEPKKLPPKKASRV